MTTNQKAKLLAIFNTLDAALGDTDVDVTGMTQQEIQEEEPVFWCAKEIAKLLGKNWDRYASILNQIEIPTPTELAQQLADLTGQKVTIAISPKRVINAWFGECEIWLVSGGIDGWAIRGEMVEGPVIIDRPVNYTGRWQDSKVTATPNHIAHSRKKVNQSGDATDMVDAPN